MGFDKLAKSFAVQKECDPVAELLENSVASHTEPSAEDQFADDFDQDLDTAFNSLVGQHSPIEADISNPELLPKDQAVVEDLFGDIAANYARPVKNFIFQLKRGTATKEWIEICLPALQGIRRSAESMGLMLAAHRMIEVETALSRAQKSKPRVLSGEIRNRLLSCYEDLITAMPQAFVVGEEEQRESIIINALLMQIPNLGRVTVEKLYRAGLTSLDALCKAQGDELAAAAGIPASMSERICEKFQWYRVERTGRSRYLGASGQRRRLSQMLAELRSVHEGFQHPTKNKRSKQAFAAEKRVCRQQRQTCWLRINVLLAEMGEVDLLNKLKKLSFERRIQRLEGYISSP